jgi:hypothetical protein
MKKENSHQDTKTPRGKFFYKKPLCLRVFVANKKDT